MFASVFPAANDDSRLCSNEISYSNVIETLNEIYLMKFEIRNFTIHYSVSKTREIKHDRIILEQRIKAFEQDLEAKEHNKEYLDCNQKLNDNFD